jgi:hypothetical protein
MQEQVIKVLKKQMAEEIIVLYAEMGDQGFDQKMLSP